jgi:hypothetical protein
VEPYTAFSFESSIVGAGDDGYVDELARLAATLAGGDPDAVAVASRSVGRRRHPIPRLPAGLTPRPPGSGVRRGASAAVIEAMFARDGYRCRYCGTRTIAKQVLEAMAVAARPFGPVFPRGKQWRIDSTHPAFYWQYATNDHVMPRARGGAVDDVDNLASACWPCQAR